MSKQPLGKDFGFYVALSQVGCEMVLPLCVGLIIDHYANTRPWGTVIGFVLGFVGGFCHLLLMLQRHEAAQRSRQSGDKEE
jgi:F0F1-type ATP synthase assembly protein I